MHGDDTVGILFPSFDVLFLSGVSITRLSMNYLKERIIPFLYRSQSVHEIKQPIDLWGQISFLITLMG